LVSSEETGLEVNAEKTLYRFMPRKLNAGQTHNINIGTSKKSFQRVEHFKYSETT